MKKRLGIVTVCIVLIVAGSWLYFAVRTPSLPAWNPSTHVPATTTGQFDISQYNIVPAQFVWTPVGNEDNDLGIFYERPSFWTFQSRIVNNGQEYTADFNRASVVNASNTPQNGKSQFENVLSIDYSRNIVGTTPNAGPATPDQYLAVYFPSSSTTNFAKTIGGIHLIKSYTGENMVYYTFFTDDHVIQFITRYASDAELGIVEQMIASFKLRNKKIVAPNTFGNYKVEG